MTTIEGAPTTLVVAREDRPDAAVLRLAGELDLSTAPRVNDEVDELLAAACARVVIDLAGVTFCDSTGLAAFVRAHRHCTAAGGWVRLTGAGGGVARVLHISGLDTLLCGDPAA